MDHSYTACLFHQGKLLAHCYHEDLDKITAKLLTWLELADRGAKGIIYDHNTHKVVNTYSKRHLE